MVLALANVFVFFMIAGFLKDFKFEGGFEQMFLVALTFTLLNYILKPVLKLLLGPVIILTLGLGLIFVNMLVLIVLDKLTTSLSIENVLTLVYASLIVGATNFILHLLFKKK